MGEPIRIRKLWFAAISTVLFLLGVPLAHAVIQNVSIVDANGNALANTTVTITFPSGKQEEDDTDEKGILIFDADEDGEYVLVYPGGRMTISVGGAGGFPTGGKVAAAVIATGVIASEAVGDDDRVTSSSGGTSGGGGTPPPPPPTGMIDGNYTASTSVIENADMHPDNFNGQEYIVMTSSGTSVTVGVSGTNISFSASGTLSGNDFNATTSSGLYASFTTQIDVTGTFDPTAGTWSGEMTAGADGTLPDTNGNGTAEPIVVFFTGMRL